MLTQLKLAPRCEKMLINQRLTDTPHKGKQMKKETSGAKCWRETRLCAIRCRRGEIIRKSHFNALLLAEMSAGRVSAVREKEEEEITWCRDLFLVPNLMMNTRMVHHGRLSQWGPISLWLDLWHIYAPLSKGRVTPPEREQAAVHDWQEENYVAIIVNHGWIWGTTSSVFISRCL